MYIPYDIYLRPDPLRITQNRFLSRIAAPDVEPVTLAEAKLYMRIDNNNDDTLINDLIVSARMMAESWLRRSLITQTWKMAFDYGIPESVWLPMCPISSITSVVVFNKDGSSNVQDSSTYWLNAAQNAIVMWSRLIGFRIEITYVAGYGEASDVPRPIKQGLLAHIASLYDSRGDGAEAAFPDQTVALYTQYREIRL